MRRITAVIDDEVDLTPFIGQLAGLSTSFSIEHIANGHDKTVTVRNVVPGQKTDDVLMKHFSPNASFTVHKAREWVMKEGYSKKSADGAIHTLTKSGHVERLGRGHYKFVKPYAGL